MLVSTEGTMGKGMTLSEDVKTVQKVWGIEKWIVNDNEHSYCHKKLIVYKGAGVSMHAHPIKAETFTLDSGKIQLLLEDQMGIKEEITMLPGHSKTIFPGVYHSFVGYKDSVITEVSTFHSDEDVLRKYPSFVNETLYGVDVDGTLEAAGGKVRKEHLAMKDFVIISSRSRERSKEICDIMGLEPLAIYTCRVVQRAEEMMRVDRDYPLRPTIYVGDMQSDKMEAELAGWQFFFHDEFANERIGK